MSNFSNFGFGAASKRASIKNVFSESIINSTRVFGCFDNEYFLVSIEYDVLSPSNNFIKFGNRVVTPTDDLRGLGHKNELRNNMIRGGLGEDLTIYSSGSNNLNVLVYKMEIL